MPQRHFFHITCKVTDIMPKNKNNLMLFIKKGGNSELFPPFLIKYYM